MNINLWDYLHMDLQFTLKKFFLIFLKKIKKNIFKLNLKFFNHQKKGFRYIADENLIIDQIFNKNLDELFKIELDKDKSFKKIWLPLYKKYMSIFLKKKY